MTRHVTAPAHPRLWTAEDLESAGPPYDRAELWDGIPVVCEPGGDCHGAAAATLVARLRSRVGSRSPGWVFGNDTGFIVARDPDRVLAPDLAYVSRSRLAALTGKFIPFAPDFAVEIRSPRDSETSVAVKCGFWLTSGVPVVWAVDPVARTVVVHRLGAVPEEARGEDDVVDAAPVLPEFRLRLAEVFEGLR